MRMGTSIVPALALLAVVSGDQASAQQQAVRPGARPQAQAPPPQAGIEEPRRLGRSYPMPPPPIPQRETPQFYVATPQSSSVHRSVGERRNDGSRMGDATDAGSR